MRPGARQVKDDATTGDRARDRSRIGDVPPNHLDAPLFQPCGLRLVPQQRDNRVPVGQKTVDQVCADEAGGARDGDPRHADTIR